MVILNSQEFVSFSQKLGTGLSITAWWRKQAYIIKQCIVYTQIEKKCLEFSDDDNCLKLLCRTVSFEVFVNRRVQKYNL